MRPNRADARNTALHSSAQQRAVVHGAPRKARSIPAAIARNVRAQASCTDGSPEIGRGIAPGETKGINPCPRMRSHIAKTDWFGPEASQPTRMICSQAEVSDQKRLQPKKSIGLREKAANAAVAMPAARQRRRHAR